VGRGKEGQSCVRVRVETPGGATQEVEVKFGDLALLSLPEDGEARVRVTADPDRAFDVGAGKGKAVTREVRGGVVGLLVDARGRQPFELPADPKKRIERLRAWNRTVGLYPREL
jgi:hypothetical protein